MRSSVFSRTLLALIDPQPVATPGGGLQNRAQQQQQPAAAAAAAVRDPAAAPLGPGALGAQPGLPTPEPDPAAVARLCGMGFGREQVEAALRAAFNDEETAVNRLLG